MATKPLATAKPLSVDDPHERILSLHDQVDRETAEIERHHVDRLLCRQGCSSCCVDEISVFEVEAERIRRRHGALLAEATPHRVGACAFLDEQGACRIYESRPYVCRTQGLPLRFFHEDAQGEIVEERDICSLNLEGPPLESIPDSQCWTLGPTELLLGQLQESTDGGKRLRVTLRSLFATE